MPPCTAALTMPFLFYLLDPAPCDQGIDLGILIDRSLSIRRKNVERLLKGFMPRFLKQMSVSRKKTHIGIIMYNREAQFLAPFNGPKSRSRRRAISFIKSLDPGVASLTRTDKGLTLAYSQLFVKKNGDRRKKQNVLLTFTDGRAYRRKHIKPFSETVPPLTVGLQVSICFRFQSVC